MKNYLISLSFMSLSLAAMQNKGPVTCTDYINRANWTASEDERNSWDQAPSPIAAPIAQPQIPLSVSDLINHANWTVLQSERDSWSQVPSATAPRPTNQQQRPLTVDDCPLQNHREE